MRLELFQKLFLCWLYERKPNGRYRYRRALLEVPKGNGKSSLSAWVGADQLATQHSAVIPVAAASYDQAEILFGNLRSTVTESPTLSQVMMAFEGEVQLNNAVLKVDSRGQRIAKEHKNSSRKIDAAVAAVMAVDRAVVAAPYNILDSVW